MAIYNVKIVDDAGASTTQPIGASSDNVLIQDENISLTQKLENINDDRDALLDQIKKVESRHFTINKHIDSTNYSTDEGLYKIAKLPDGETFTNGTEWLINVTENVTQIVPVSEEENLSMSIFITSKIIFKDGKFTLISFDNKLQLDAPDEIKELIKLPENRRGGLLKEIDCDNNSFYLYGRSYSDVFENAPSSFVDIGVTFLELSNAQDCFLEGVNFEFIPKSEVEWDNILNYQYLNSDSVETDTKTSFTINNYEDEVLESGWYKIAYYDYGRYPNGECIINLQSYTNETGKQISSFLLTINYYAGIAKITPISQTLTDGINIDQIRVICDNSNNAYILIHLNLGKYESLNDWDCCVTVHNINYVQYIDDGEETLLWVAPREPFSKIIEDEIDDIYINYNITNDSLIYPLTNIDSNHQFSISGTNLETGWYKIGTTSGPLGTCMIHIYETAFKQDPNTRYEVDAVIQLRNTDMYCYSKPGFPKLLSGTVDFYTEETDEYGDKITDFAYNGFTKLGTNPSSQDGTQDWFIFYNNPGYQMQFSKITVTNLNSGELTAVMGEETMSLECGLRPCTDILSETTSGPEYSPMKLNIHDTRMEDRTKDQRTMYGEARGEGWYEIAVSDYERPIGVCTINITDRTWDADNTNLSCRILFDSTAEPSDMRMKVLSCTAHENYVGIDKFRIMHNYETGDNCIDVHISGDARHYITITIENNTPNYLFGKHICQWLPAKFEAVEEANTETRKLMCTLTPDIKNTMPATTADLEGLGGGSVSDEALEEILNEAKSYTDTKVAEAKAYTDSVVNGLINGES